MNDLLRCNRLAVANAYRRLADRALEAAEAYAAEDRTFEEHQVHGRVQGAMDSVDHARTLVDATRRGLAAGERRTA